MKHCPKCKETKQFDEFYRDSLRGDGRQGYCKLCMNAVNKGCYLKNIDNRKKRLRKYHKEHREELRRYSKEYYKLNRVEIRDRIRQYKIDNPEAVKAHGLVDTAIRSAKIIPCKCENCGSRDAAAHHEDYSKPLDIKWLCKSCHQILHRSNQTITSGYN